MFRKTPRFSSYVSSADSPDTHVRVVLRSLAAASAYCLLVGTGVAEERPETLPAAQGIVFDSKRLVLTAEAGKSEAVGTFSFTNRGKEAVRLVKADSACPCVDLVFEKADVAPGASSEIIIILHLESLKDAESKTVLTQFVSDKGAVTRHALKIDVQFPEIAKITPPELLLNGGDTQTGRDVVVTLAEGAGFRIRDWSSTVPGVQATEVKEASAGTQRFSVSITGDTLPAATGGYLTFNTTSRIPHYQQLRIPVRIR